MLGLSLEAGARPVLRAGHVVRLLPLPLADEDVPRDLVGAAFPTRRALPARRLAARVPVARRRVERGPGRNGAVVASRVRRARPPRLSPTHGPAAPRASSSVGGGLHAAGGLGHARRVFSAAELLPTAARDVAPQVAPRARKARDRRRTGRALEGRAAPLGLSDLSAVAPGAGDLRLGHHLRARRTPEGRRLERPRPPHLRALPRRRRQTQLRHAPNPPRLHLPTAQETRRRVSSQKRRGGRRFYGKVVVVAKVARHRHAQRWRRLSHHGPRPGAAPEHDDARGPLRGERQPRLRRPRPRRAHSARGHAPRPPPVGRRRRREGCRPLSKKAQGDGLNVPPEKKTSVLTPRDALRHQEKGRRDDDRENEAPEEQGRLVASALLSDRPTRCPFLFVRLCSLLAGVSSFFSLPRFIRRGLTRTTLRRRRSARRIGATLSALSCPSSCP
mmetsp:Transcript_826/g.2333  ORF Transcript_826/g.2333 Transcript_826/m.2333 type:complete len:445 (+) Transcript_826:412-1746(+)